MPSRTPSAGPGRFVERRQGDRQRIPALTVLWHPLVSRIGERVRCDELVASAGDGGASPAQVVVSSRSPVFATAAGEPSSPLGTAAGKASVLVSGGSAGPGSVRVVPGDGPGPVGQVKLDGQALPAEGVDFSGPRVEAGIVVELPGEAVLLLHALPARLTRQSERFGLVGDSEEIEQVRREIRRVADLDVPVLLRGETGTGKELVARGIHEASRRRDRKLLSVNLGAIPPTLAASELFGATKGAFTGAVSDRSGFFVRAHGSTLFLDEVGEAPPEVQVMLLRVLETGEVQPLGAQEVVTVDVRLIAATDGDLESAAAEGSFRAPLLHRLAGYEIGIPPLVRRRDDFGRLFVHFLRRELARLGESWRLEEPSERPWLPASIVARLARHPWPGNVRQLDNAARQLVIGSRGADVVRVGPQIERLLREASAQTPDDEPAVLPMSPGGRAADPEPAEEPSKPTYRDPSEVTDDELVEALRDHRWAVQPTARALGVSRTSLYALIERSPEVRKAGDLTGDEIEAARAVTDGTLAAMSEELEVSEHGLRQRMKELGV